MTLHYFNKEKTYFSDQVSLFILNILNIIFEILLFFARLNFYFLVIAMFYYLFHDLHINNFDLFVDYWIKYQFIIIDNFSFDILIYALCYICSFILFVLKEKYNEKIYINS